MPYYRFENMEQITTNPHLSTGTGAIVNGHYLSLRNNNKAAGTGSQLHYHPNELMIFLIAGRLNAVVGKDQRIIEPGTFIHVPPNARHSMKATEDGPVSYLYCKDNTWTLTGIAADEAPPETAPTIEEIKKVYESGKWPGQEKNESKSEAVIEGLKDCYLPIMKFNDPEHSGRVRTWYEGERMSFGYFESPPGYEEQEGSIGHERFMYIMSGTLESSIDGETKKIGSGDLLHFPRHAKSSFRVGNGTARYAVYQSNSYLESKIAE
jgi:quercetin dioxygenase-like cupin family protein